MIWFQHGSSLPAIAPLLPLAAAALLLSPVTVFAFSAQPGAFRFPRCCLLPPYCRAHDQWDNIQIDPWRGSFCFFSPQHALCLGGTSCPYGWFGRNFPCFLLVGLLLFSRLTASSGSGLRSAEQDLRGKEPRSASAFRLCKAACTGERVEAQTVHEHEELFYMLYSGGRGAEAFFSFINMHFSRQFFQCCFPFSPFSFYHPHFQTFFLLAYPTSIYRLNFLFLSELFFLFLQLFLYFLQQHSEILFQETHFLFAT